MIILTYQQGLARVSADNNESKSFSTNSVPPLTVLQYTDFFPSRLMHRLPS